MPISEIRDLVDKYFGKRSPELSKLHNLWRLLSVDIFRRQDDASFASDHGKQHIRNVLSNINDLLRLFSQKEIETIFKRKDLCEIFSAIMIHDSGMVDLMGKTGEDAKIARLGHANYKIIYNNINTLLEHVPFNDDEKENIIRIASAHDKDNEKSIEKKLNDIISKYTKESHLYLGAIMLLFADFFDVGLGRLRKNAYKLPWDDEQKSFFNKNRVLKVTIVAQDKDVLLSLAEVPVNYELSRKARFEILYKIWGEGEAIVSRINESILHKKGKWTVKITEDFGKIYPIGQVRWANLFNKEFIPALNEWKSNAYNQGRPMEVDMMGHSLYARFVENREEVNHLLKENLEAGDIAIRVLILDPFIENQQMCEVFLAQRESIKPEEQIRSILPKFSHDWIIVDGQEGDIRKSLMEMKDWGVFVKGRSSLEVRGTSSVMNMGLTRYGNLMIITPYSNKGLFNNSCAIEFNTESPLFDDSKAEFDNLWANEDSRLLYHKYSKHSTNNNPISRLFRPQMVPDPIIPSFEYEKFILESYRDRILNLFFVKSIEGANYNIPPYEIEIQPSTYCGFNCIFCIGAHLNRRSSHHYLADLHEGNLDSIFYECSINGKNYKVERFRISGLTGDPLSEPVQEFTLRLIEKIKVHNREVVIITNGLYLNKPAIIDKILNVNCIHISLDAATKESFSRVKRIDGNLFDKIISNIDDIINKSKKINDYGRKVKVGIGFVITQENYHEALKAIEMATELGVGFIRFKPDIRMIGGITWEAWKTVEHEIKLKQIEIRKKKQLGDKQITDIIITEVMLFHHLFPRMDKCWLQYFNATLGPDGNVYPCDHLTSNGQEIKLGNLNKSLFSEIWENPSHRGTMGINCPECQICPPFGWRLNRLLDELFILYKEYGNDGLNYYIDDALI